MYLWHFFRYLCTSTSGNTIIPLFMIYFAVNAAVITAFSDLL